MSVKLVSVPGVGTVAAGVTKAHADKVIIAGYDGGTGAARADLAQARRAAVGARAGRDPADVAAQPVARAGTGAGRRRAEDARGTSSSPCCSAREEFGFSTAPLVVAGCVMMRVCHLDTCPVGIATAEPGAARAVHRHAGVRRDLLHSTSPSRSGSTWRRWASGPSPRPSGTPRCWTSSRRGRAPPGPRPGPRAAAGDRQSDQRLLVHPPGAARPVARRWTPQLIELAAPALQDARGVRIDLPIRNVDRTAGTMLGSEVTRIYGPDGLPDHTIEVQPDRHRRAVARRVPAPRRRPSPCSATRTTMSARDCRVGGSSSGRTRTRRPRRPA